LSQFLEATQAFEKYQKTTSLLKKISKNQLKTFLKNVEFLHLSPKLLPAKKREMTSSLFPFHLILNYEKTYF